MAYIRTGGGKEILNDIVIGISNSQAATWCILPAELVAKFTKIRRASATEANDAIPTNYRYGSYDGTMQFGLLSLTDTPVDLSTATPMENGDYAFRLNQNTAYGGIVLIP